MQALPSSPSAGRGLLRRPLATLIFAVAVSWPVLSAAAMGDTATASPLSTSGAAGASSQGALATLPGSKVLATATLQQCATATIPQTERSVTFAGEMSAIPGSARMEIRIELEERGPEELTYHTVSSPGLGVWHGSLAGVKVFMHIQQVTNLSAPALYRGTLRFRWLNDRSRTIKVEQLRTARCEQPAPAPSTGAPSTPGTGSTNPTTTSPTG